MERAEAVLFTYKEELIMKPKDEVKELLDDLELIRKLERIGHNPAELTTFRYKVQTAIKEAVKVWMDTR